MASVSVGESLHSGSEGLPSRSASVGDLRGRKVSQESEMDSKIKMEKTAFTTLLHIITISSIVFILFATGPLGVIAGTVAAMTAAIIATHLRSPYVQAIQPTASIFNRNIASPERRDSPALERASPPLEIPPPPPPPPSSSRRVFSGPGANLFALGNQVAKKATERQKEIQEACTKLEEKKSGRLPAESRDLRTVPLPSPAPSLPLSPRSSVALPSPVVDSSLGVSPQSNTKQANNERLQRANERSEELLARLKEARAQLYKKLSGQKMPEALDRNDDECLMAALEILACNDPEKAEKQVGIAEKALEKFEKQARDFSPIEILGFGSSPFNHDGGALVFTGKFKTKEQIYSNQIE